MQTVTHYGRHTVCDACHRTVPVLDPEGWENLEGHEAPDAHLCPKCIDKRDRGLLPYKYVFECDRCGRNHIHNPEIKRFHSPEPPPGGRRRNCCSDCWDEISDAGHP